MPNGLCRYYSKVILIFSVRKTRETAVNIFSATNFSLTALKLKYGNARTFVAGNHKHFKGLKKNRRDLKWE